ncbi:hypothetical protein RLO149_c037390 [Roseobacter litoralis Och 149]|uniref:Uncharacterized protein n=1 Tax=Roseobacter litoralis (strain ATCC 49566 / DSM 6996 / JCM 21268 / NBRC 15278 / OCh 149) TaxID=391595 RepID=F7ZC80_ROSLO|nr:hypothetical protein RLO149_c037390 [Roseobacter litoralis Och 149]
MQLRSIRNKGAVFPLSRRAEIVITLLCLVKGYTGGDKRDEAVPMASCADVRPIPHRPEPKLFCYRDLSPSGLVLRCDW